MLACEALILPIKSSLPLPMGFLTFTLLILFPIPPGKEWESNCVGLSCLPGLTHSIYKRKTWIKYLLPIILEHLGKQQAKQIFDFFFSVGYQEKLHHVGCH